MGERASKFSSRSLYRSRPNLEARSHKKLYARRRRVLKVLRLLKLLDLRSGWLFGFDKFNYVFY